ncbi:C39 family peptidase [Candidatus Dojkabacteria bacterium]|nr:C39 family peptidase [Candidatus Dojkabacteria bacterium]
MINPQQTKNFDLPQNINFVEEKPTKAKNEKNRWMIVPLFLALAALSFLIYYFVTKFIAIQRAKDCYTEEEQESQIEDYEQEITSLQLKILELEDQINSTSNPPRLNTYPSTVIMNVETYKQTHPASCESASAHILMKYFGVDVTEDQIIAEIGADTTSTRYFDDQGNLHWGNPQRSFVGNIDGEVVYVDGYGVYNEPVYKVLANHGFSSSISKTNWDVDELFNYVRQGYPVIVWVSNDFKPKTVGTMIGPDGEENPWIEDEHALVIHGIDPEKIYLMDVGFGTYDAVSYPEFRTGFQNLENMAIVVIKD